MSDFLGYFNKDNLNIDNLNKYKSHLNFENFSIFYSEDFDLSFTESEDTIIVFKGFLSNELLSTREKKEIRTNYASIVQRHYFNFKEKFHLYLSGNFTLVLFDKNKKELLILRDRFGSRPVYYSKYKNFFVFSSNIKDLSEINLLEISLNKHKMMDFLSLRYRNYEDTFFKNINKVKYSSYLSFKDQKIEFIDYSAKFKKYPSNIDFFKFFFEKAIKNSIPFGLKKGVMLSGGLDSSAIATGFSNLGKSEIYGFSGNFCFLPDEKKENTDETEYQEIISNLLNIEHSKIDLKDISPFETINKYLSVMSEPFHMPNLYLFEKIAQEASRKKIEVLFDGQDGDNVISHGLFKFFDLFSSLKIFSLAKEIISYSNFHKIKKFNVFKFVIINFFKKKFHIYRKRNDTILNDKDFFSKDYYWKDFDSPFNSHKENMDSDLHSIAFEYRYLFFKNFEIETRSPFYDSNLVDYCISLDSKWKLNKGKTRYILRSYLDMYLPKSISMRHKKANLSNGLIFNLSHKDYSLLKEEYENMNSFLRKIIDIEKLEAILNKFKNPEFLNEREIMSAMAFFLANKWIEKYKKIT